MNAEWLDELKRAIESEERLLKRVEGSRGDGAESPKETP